MAFASCLNYIELNYWGPHIQNVCQKPYASGKEKLLVTFYVPSPDVFTHLAYRLPG